MATVSVLLFIVLLAILGPRYGSDSRDGRDWAPRPRHGWLRRVRGDKRSPEPEECST